MDKCIKFLLRGFVFLLSQMLVDITSLIEWLVLSVHLFVKVPWLGDSEGTFLVFESSCHLLLPV